MLTIAHIISINDSWKNSRIRLKNICISEEQSIERKYALKKMLETLRIKADIEFIDGIGKMVKEIIYQSSQDADLVILGLSIPVEGMEKEYMDRVNLLTENLPTSLLVKGVNVLMNYKNKNHLHNE